MIGHNTNPDQELIVRSTFEGTALPECLLLPTRLVMPKFDPVRDAIVTSSPEYTPRRRRSDLSMLLNDPLTDSHRPSLQSSASPLPPTFNPALPSPFLSPHRLPPPLRSPPFPSSSPSPPQQPPRYRSPISVQEQMLPPPYQPRQRRTDPKSVLVPITQDEIDFFKRSSKNWLRTRPLDVSLPLSSPYPPYSDPKGKRRYDGYDDEHVSKRSRDSGLVAQHCKSPYNPTTSSFLTPSYKNQVSLISLSSLHKISPPFLLSPYKQTTHDQT